jgi:hypothetical protein
MTSYFDFYTFLQKRLAMYKPNLPPKNAKHPQVGKYNFCLAGIGH